MITPRPKLKKIEEWILHMKPYHNEGLEMTAEWWDRGREVA